MKRWMAIWVLMVGLIPAALADVRGLLQLIDYVGVDYPEAVQGGAVVNADEYAEMEEFSARIKSEIEALPQTQPGRADLAAAATELGGVIAAKGEPSAVMTLTQSMREQLLAGGGIALVPERLPDLQAAAKLYQTHCALCHGVEGRGDGPAAATLEPAPTDFHDRERASQRSLFGLFNTITLGVEGTGMTAFPHLSDAERWSLAFYVGGLHADTAALADAAAGWQQQPLTLREAATLAPAELAAKRADGAELGLWLRHHPEALFAGRQDPLTVAEQKLGESLAAFRGGDRKGALDLAVVAYLEGFELSEAALSNISPTLMRGAESAMMAYRHVLAGTAPAAEVESAYQQALAKLAESREALGGESLSAGVAFTSSLVILLREGLEAILVLAAMAAVLIKTGNRAAMRYVHAGWIVALLLGGATWAVSSYVITISGAAREVTEGVTALVAAVILFYVGFWMHSNASGKRWQHYLEGKIQAALSQRTLWTLGIVSFLAVYREVFETVLFYQALWVQVDEAAHSAVYGGAGAALVLLLIATWLILRFGLKLPLKQFFAVSAVLMIALAVVFAGHGVAALQEAGKLPITPAPVPRLEWLGIYPNWQGTALQLVVVVLGAVLLLRPKKED